MGMTLRLPTETELETAYRRDLGEAFPMSELRPFAAIREMTAAGIYHPWCLEADGELLGEAFVWAFEPGWGLFDYLCVARGRRGGGLGAALIRRVRAAEPERLLFGESEIPEWAPDRALAERRLAFYRRNGAVRAGYDTAIFGVPYHTLYWPGRAVTDAAMCAAHARAYGSRFSPAACARYIHIPWTASMGVPEKLRWTEGDGDADSGL